MNSSLAYDIEPIEENNAIMEFSEAELAASLREIAEFGLMPARVKVPSGTGSMFEFTEEDAHGNESAKEINAVILYNHPLQVYFSKAYNGANERPDCGSMDGVTGVGNPGGACAACPLNEFGTSENGGKACKQKRRLFLLPEGETFPMILDLPNGSVRNFGTYLRRLIKRRKKPSYVVTCLSLQKATSNAGTTYSQVVFNTARDLTQEEYEKLKPFCEQAEQFSASLDFCDDSELVEGEVLTAEGDVIPDYDPETGEVF